MKKIIITVLALAAFSSAALAIPARPGWRTFTQPDGTTLELCLVGDEFGHALKDRSGQCYRRDADGYLRPIDKTVVASMHKAASARRAQANAKRIRSKSSEIISGSPKIPVLLVEFKDQKFKTESQLSAVYNGTAQEAFTKLLTENGYSYNGATGSVLDFYIDNSNGVYTPVFDVLPVVSLTNNMATYGANEANGDDTAPELAVYEAVKSLDASVDFSQYDNDGDGYVDMILMYYAGFNEAEYGPEDSIWPHQWSVQESGKSDGGRIQDKQFDGKKLHKYFCTSELSSTSKTKGQLCGVGTTCHEFAHSLGLPDFYDTDYEDNGSAGGTYTYDTMCSGAYDNNGNTPPFFGAEELVMLGWMDDIPELPSVGQITIPALSKTTKVAYKAPSTTEGEYFVFECRGSSSWDKYILGYKAGPGLLVYHVDKSNTRVYSSYTAKVLWDDWESTNAINAVGNHPCYYIIPAACQNYNADNTKSDGYSGNPTATTGLNYSGSAFTFGTNNSYREYTPVDWKKETMDYTLKNINYTDGSVTFSVGMDLCYINVPETLKNGNAFPLSLTGAPSGSTVKWYWDDVSVAGPSVVMTSGKHTVEANITAGKKTIRIEVEVDVE